MPTAHLNIRDLTNEELVEELKKNGFEAGPVDG